MGNLPAGAGAQWSLPQIWYFGRTVSSPPWICVLSTALCRVLGESRGGDRMERGAGLAELRWGSKGGRSRGGDPMHFTSPSQHFVISGVSKSLSSVEQPFDSVHQLILNIKLINITC